MIKDDPVAWDNPATVAYQKHRRRTTAVQAAACVALIFVAAQFSKYITGFSDLLVFVNTVLFVATLGFLSAFSRLSLRERTLRMSDWSPAEVVGHPFSIWGVPVGTVLRIAASGPEDDLLRIVSYRFGAELLDASRQSQTLLRAGEKDRGFVLAAKTGTPVVLARRIGPGWLQNLVWISASQKEMK